MNNAKFWDDRYEELPKLGSGPGSRGYAAWYKNRIIKESIAFSDARSILDIGCGDLCWLDDEILNVCDYTGIDISSIAIQKARITRPSLNFAVHDIVFCVPPFSADLVISFDVLIHQIAEYDFHRAVDNILCSFDRLALISYSTPPEIKSPLPDDPEILFPEVVASEAEFQRMRAEDLPPDFARAATSYHGPLPAKISSLRPDLAVSIAGRYRWQTIYKVMR